MQSSSWEKEAFPPTRLPWGAFQKVYHQLYEYSANKIMLH